MSANLIKKSAVALAISASLLAISAQATEVTAAKNLSLEVLKVESFDRSLKNKASKTALKTFPNYFIVKLENEPLTSLASSSASAKGNKLNLNSANAKKQMNRLAKERAQFANALKAKIPNATVERYYDTVFNGVVVTSTEDIYEQLKNVAGVTRVFREEMSHASMDTSVSLINATKVWEQMGGAENAGKGVKVAVIDTGIRPENPMFSDEGFTAPESLPMDDYCHSVADFCNNKLIVARSPTPTFEVHPDEHFSPLGYGSHGSHVAGTSVGNKTSIEFEGTEVDISGVAPGAYLMVYKGLFTTPSGGGSGSNVMLLEMLDWAVKDGADVINNSWGGGAGGDPANSVYADAFMAAEEAGVVVVSAAGNDGPEAQTIGCPSCVESGITVANTTHGRFFANSVDFEGDSLLALEGNNYLLETDITLPVVASFKVEEANFEGCLPYADAYFSDSIALISRGACSFSDKAANAKAAGAEAIIVYNSSASQPIPMYLPDAEIPSVMISMADGLSIVESLGDEAVEVTINAEVSRVIAPAFADNMADSSSRGPGGDHDSLKPDIAAPGTDILSAFSPDDSGVQFGTMTGTSMASPHVAGAAAVMKSLYPDWSATDIKTALTSTSKTSGILKQDAETPVDAFDVGAGRLDLEMASKAMVTFDKPSFAKNPCVASCSFTRTIKNMGNAEAQWEATVTFDNPAMTASVSPAMVTLAAKSTAMATDEVVEDLANAEFNLDVDSRFGEYKTWEFGQVTWKDKSGQNPDAHMPVAIYVSDSADSATLSTFADASEVINGDEFGVNAVFNNAQYSKQIVIKATAPAGTAIVEGSERADVMNGSEILLDNDGYANRVVWTGKLAKPEMSTNTYSGIGYTLAEDGGYQLDCDAECDESQITLNLGNIGAHYMYNGVMQEVLSISDNGIIVAGNGSTAGSWKNQNLPDSAGANNVIAPFWTDFDLEGTANTSGGGTLWYNILTMGGVDYLVIEWYKAQPYADSEAREYTFQTWIALGDSEDVFFNYIDIAETLPEGLTVGAENISGTVGISHYYNGEGMAPVSESLVALSAIAGGSVNLSYNLAVTGDLDLGMADSATTTEDSGAVSIDVLANEKMSETKPLIVEVMHEGAKTLAVETVKVSAKGEYDVTSLMLSTPVNGTAVVSEAGMVEYTPNADFTGTDTFTYTVKDEAGTSITATSVSVEVTPVNDAPMVVANSSSNVQEGEAVKLSVVGTDVDGDDLTYTWTQVSGTNASIRTDATSDTLRFDAPSISSDETITFSVVASDGELSSEAVTVDVAVTNKSSGGSFGWLALFAAPLAFIRRRKAQK